MCYFTAHFTPTKLNQKLVYPTPTPTPTSRNGMKNSSWNSTGLELWCVCMIKSSLELWNLIFNFSKMWKRWQSEHSARCRGLFTFSPVLFICTTGAKQSTLIYHSEKFTRIKFNGLKANRKINVPSELTLNNIVQCSMLWYRISDEISEQLK